MGSLVPVVPPVGGGVIVTGHWTFVVQHVCVPFLFISSRGEARQGCQTPSGSKTARRTFLLQALFLLLLNIYTLRSHRNTP